MIWDTSASVAHAITSLDGQALQLSDDGTIISHALISRLDALKINLEKLRSETNENLGSVTDMSPSRGKIPLLGSQEATSPLRAPPRLTVVPPPETFNGSNQAPIQRPTSPADCWLQAFKTGKLKAFSFLQN
ncbi:unnamed protein product [Schistocephalus solidus]|uniref:Uncharacterized protein n=1 Tax=Schistocephalus solidus TaxID=70667 RepID=A0A183SQX6_SCHSO|nr:unnamed protein product [Schistocephalus solidus]